VAEYQLPVPIFTCASLPGPLYVSPCKISAKSDYPRLSYCDLTNLSYPPSAILDFWEKSVFGPLKDLAIDAHAKFGKDNSGFVLMLFSSFS